MHVAVKLFEHNQKAYLSAVAMLEQKGKAAIVHPTGTGKSFIAFQLALDQAEKRILWLGPSEYIYATQLESLARCGGPDSLSNVTFRTYAKLLLLGEDELDVGADYIILDEFHRCGAEQWGNAVQRTIAANPDAKLLGLSATNVRYLDNMRDMAEELFEGHIASELSLGEAIVRGILPAPKYVTTVFKYQNELERYQKQVCTMRPAALRDVNQKYLDALRRALEQADGLEQVFARHMTSKSGKYIVFCSGMEHMREMMEQSRGWFAGVNPDIHFYMAYSEDPGTSKAFVEFKADSSSALKLLFCIDMLNEGVHVNGISGVILFRPTISPIIYKQQIGRALTAGDSVVPLILDVVNNFEGLCSIDTLKEEMATAVQHMYAVGEGEKIVTERFQVVEQVQDCRVLFETLRISLSGTWEQYFAAAKEYAAEYGDLKVPKKYKTAAGLSLGSWIGVQRSVYAGNRAGSLSESQIERLNSIGMIWENRLESAWENGFEHAKAYYEEFGDLLVPARYKSPDGFLLGSWISNLRQRRLNGEQSELLDEERIARLDSIGMAWDASSVRWEKNYCAALEYYNAHGDLLVPFDYKTPDGLALGTWVRSLRQARKGEFKRKPPTQEQIERLDKIGMYWGNCNENQWMQGYEAAKQYFQAHGNLDVPTMYKTNDGVLLGKWVARQRYVYQNPEKSTKPLTQDRIDLLEGIGMIWQKADSWQHRYELAQKYLEEHGNLNIPATYKTDDGIWLGRWIYEQRRALQPGAKKTLPIEKREKLKRLGIRNAKTAMEKYKGEKDRE